MGTSSRWCAKLPLRLARRYQIWRGARAFRPQLPDFAALRHRRAAVVRRRLGLRARRAHRNRSRRRCGRYRWLRQHLPAQRCGTRVAHVATCSCSVRSNRRSRPPKQSRRGDNTRTVGQRSSGHVSALDSEHYRVLRLPGHARRAVRTHTSAPVPYLLFDSRRRVPAAGTASAVAGRPKCASALKSSSWRASSAEEARIVAARGVGH
jgi:hypothetical protein